MKNNLNEKDPVERLLFRKRISENIEETEKMMEVLERDLSEVKTALIFSEEGKLEEEKSFLTAKFFEVKKVYTEVSDLNKNFKRLLEAAIKNQ
jgi:uncharacterized protein YoxC